MLKKIVFWAVLMLLFSCQTTDNKKQEKKGKKAQYPEQIQELILPSGFDNDYVKNLLEGKMAKYVKPVIRIMDFEITQSFKKAVNYHDIKMEEKLKSEVAKTGRFTLLGTHDDLKAVIDEQKKLGDEAFDTESGPEMGYLKIAAFTLVGKITHSIPVVKQMGGHFSLKVSVGVSLTMTDATTGEIAYTKNITAENEEKLFVSAEGLIIEGPRNLTNKPLNAINARGTDIDLVPQYLKALDSAIFKTVYFLEEKNPIMGEVIKVKNNEIITTASLSDGLKAGDFLFIVRIGEPMQDSSGRVLGFDKTMVGAARVRSVESNLSSARLVKLKDQDFLPEKQDIIISLPATVSRN